jgi:hypothetical protein
VEEGNGKNSTHDSQGGRQLEEWAACPFAARKQQFHELSRSPGSAGCSHGEFHPGPVTLTVGHPVSSCIPAEPYFPHP